MSALFSAFGLDWHQLFAQLVNFMILTIALIWLLYKPVMKMVKERERVVAKGVEDAEEAARVLACADDEANQRIDKAETEATDIVNTARQSASDERARITKEAEMRAGQIAADAVARAKETAAKALRESEKEIARLATLAAAKVLAERSN